MNIETYAIAAAAALVILLMIVVIAVKRSRSRVRPPLAEFRPLTPEQRSSRHSRPAKDRELRADQSPPHWTVPSQFRPLLKNGIAQLYSGPVEEDPVEYAPAVNAIARDEVAEATTSLAHFGAAFDILRSMDDPNANVEKLAKIIRSNPALAAAILRTANSAYFGLMQQVESISRAILVLGFRHVKTILLRDFLDKSMPAASKNERASQLSIWTHTALTSISASYVAQCSPRLDPATLYTLGLLHDIGRFIMPRLRPTMPLDTIDAELEDLNLAEERFLFGIDHAQAGQIAAEAWGLPPLLCRVIGRHHAPGLWSPSQLDLEKEENIYLAALYASDQIANLLRERAAHEHFMPMRDEWKHYISPTCLEHTLLDAGAYQELCKTWALVGSYF